MKIIKLNNPRAAKALETIRYTKKPEVFISASITVGEEQGKAFKETMGFCGDEPFPVFYKLRDSRYGILGFKKEFPNASYYPVTTYRYGEGYSNVNVELTGERVGKEIAGEELLGFYDPMVSRGTTAVNTVSMICKNGQVEVLSTFHFFVAEPGLERLTLDLQKYFLKDYVIILGMRGFEVDTSGYMGAIMREQDYGDVMDGTWFKEYPREVEQKLVEDAIQKGARLEVIMAYILSLLLKHKYARYPNFERVPTSLKVLATKNWINAAMFYLQQQGAEIFIYDWEQRFLGTGLAVPESPTIAEALRQMQREWLIDVESEMRYGRKHEIYHITPFGDSYLKSVYLPVLGRNNLLTNFNSKLEEAIPEVMTGKFGDLVKKLNLQKSQKTMLTND
jgi:DNA-binding PadR family transcriptional regulator